MGFNNGEAPYKGRPKAVQSNGKTNGVILEESLIEIPADVATVLVHSYICFLH